MQLFSGSQRAIMCFISFDAPTRWQGQFTMLVSQVRQLGAMRLTCSHVDTKRQSWIYLVL